VLVAAPGFSFGATGFSKACQRAFVQLAARAGWYAINAKKGLQPAKRLQYLVREPTFSAQKARENHALRRLAHIGTP
jgi:hypothetical protein